jgi:hypothetical protein
VTNGVKIDAGPTFDPFPFHKQKDALSQSTPSSSGLAEEGKEQEIMAFLEAKVFGPALGAPNVPQHVRVGVRQSGTG